MVIPTLVGYRFNGDTSGGEESRRLSQLELNSGLVGAAGHAPKKNKHLVRE